MTLNWWVRLVDLILHYTYDMALAFSDLFYPPNPPIYPTHTSFPQKLANVLANVDFVVPSQFIYSTVVITIQSINVIINTYSLIHFF